MKPNYIYAPLGNGTVELKYASNVHGKIKIPGKLNGFTVTAIGNFAFKGCSALTSVTIPNSVTNINSYAFRNCTGLTSVTIPASVTYIGDGAFSGCTGLTRVNFRNSVQYIGGWAFPVTVKFIRQS